MAPPSVGVLVRLKGEVTLTAPVKFCDASGTGFVLGWVHLHQLVAYRPFGLERLRELLAHTRSGKTRPSTFGWGSERYQVAKGLPSL